MSSPNINVSNGTCYTAAGKTLGDGFIPCGNDAFGHQTCCGAGDTCLADLACFGVHGSGYGSLLTYFAGCTDSSYKDGSCPNKQVDQPWVALTLCDNSGGEWAICSQQGNPSTLQPGSFCSCTVAASATVAFKDATVLANVASLPQSAGQTISFFAGHSPTGSPTAGSGGSKPTSGSAGSSSRAAVSTNAVVSTLQGGSVTTIFSTITASASAAGGGPVAKLNTGAIVGVTIGAMIGVLLLIALVFLLFRRRRRRSQLESGSGSGSDATKLSKKRESDISKKHESDISKQRESDMSTSPSTLVRPTTPSMPEADSMPVAEMMGTPAEPWTLRSELAGTRVMPARQRERLPPLAELPGSEAQPYSATPRPVEEAMVSPLNLRPHSQGGQQVQSNDQSSSARPRSQ